MIAPFFADVDLRGTCGGCNAVHYKVTPTALYVNWTRVGYYAQNIDKLNSFQVIITDGTDPSVPDGNNVSFCYLDMQWTTGDASFGTNGFGGTPASVGANKGDGAGYAQIGRYDHAGNDYDGPFDNADGISWLDSTHFYFNVADTAGVPPIFASEFDCDTIEVQVGQTFDYHMLVIAGGPGQTITATSSCATLPSYQEIGNVPGSLATITSSVSPVPGEAGYHTVNYVAQNDLNTPQLSYANVVVHVLNGSPIGIEENDAHVPSLGCSVQGDQLLVTAGSGHSMEHLDLFTTEGRLLISRRVPNGSAATIDIGSLASGSYILRGTGPAGSAGARFVKN